MSICEDFLTFIATRRRRLRIVPMLGAITEQSSPVTKTPKFHSCLKGETLMAFTMTDSQQTTMSVKFVDKKGQPAKVDGAPEWSTDNTDVLALTPAADGLSCLVAAAGPLGDGTITLKADADLGAGVVPLIGTVDVSVTGGQATVVTIDPGTPSEQPVPTP